MTKLCSLEKCKVKDQYTREHCFYGYREPECWRGWLDTILLSLSLCFKRKD